MNIDNTKRFSLNVFLGLIIILLISFIYYNTASTLISDWNTNPDYSHGFFIPLISLYLIWGVVKKIEPSGLYPSDWGLLPITIGALLQIAAAVGSENFLQGLSLIIVLWSLGLYLCGREISIRLLVPIGYLIFMIPIPAILWNNISFMLKLKATGLAVYIITAFTNITLLQEGNIIHLAKGSLEVADACSGLRSLIALLALGVLMAYLSKLSLWKKIVLVITAIPVAVVTNIIRLIIIVLLADRFGIGIAESFLHLFSGVIIFILGISLLLVVHVFLIKTESNDQKRTEL